MTTLGQNRSLARPIQSPYAERPASPGQAVTRVSHCTFEVGSVLRLLPFWFGLAHPGLDTRNAEAQKARVVGHRHQRVVPTLILMGPVRRVRSELLTLKFQVSLEIDPVRQRKSP